MDNPPPRLFSCSNIPFHLLVCHYTHKMKISLACVSIVFPSLCSICHGHELHSDLCTNLRSSQHVFRQWCFENENDRLSKNEKGITWSSQRVRTSQTQSPHSWSYNPECIHSQSLEVEICVWTDTNFANGRGISVIATPESAAAVAKNKIFRDSQLARTANSVFGPPYEMRQLPGRGFGLIANRTVQRGERIFAHTPILIAQAITETGLEKDELFRLHRIAVERLPERSRDLFMALHGHFGGDPVYDRFSTNAFNVFDFAAMFPETAVCFSGGYFGERHFTDH